MEELRILLALPACGGLHLSWERPDGLLRVLPEEVAGVAGVGEGGSVAFDKFENALLEAAVEDLGAAVELVSEERQRKLMSGACF